MVLFPIDSERFEEPPPLEPFELERVGFEGVDVEGGGAATRVTWVIGKDVCESESGIGDG